MNAFVFLLPLWLIGIIFPSISDPENTQLEQFVSFLWLPLLCLIFKRECFLLGPILRQRKSVIIWMSASVLAILASALLSEEPMVSLGFVVTAALGLISCAGLWLVVGEQISKSLAIYACLGTALAGHAYFVGNRVVGRLMIGDAHPNFLGIICFGVLMCSLEVRPRVLAAALIAANLFIIIETQSRSALGAALLGLFAYAFFWAIQLRSRKAALALSVSALACALLPLGIYDFASEAFSSLFYLDDPYRGLGTGFTGRVPAWQEALDLFSDNPIFGVGFRMHEHYMTTASSAHNGYLSMLADSGVAGAFTLFTFTLLLCGLLFRRALKGDRIAILGACLVSGYLFIAAFERYFLNMGNPTSILAWIFLLSPGPIRRSQAQSLRDLRVNSLRAPTALIQAQGARS